MFDTDGIQDAKSIVTNKEAIAGAVILEPMDKGLIRMVIYRGTNDDSPYEFKVDPSKVY